VKGARVEVFGCRVQANGGLSVQGARVEVLGCRAQEWRFLGVGCKGGGLRV